MKTGNLVNGINLYEVFGRDRAIESGVAKGNKRRHKLTLID